MDDEEDSMQERIGDFSPCTPHAPSDIIFPELAENYWVAINKSFDPYVGAQIEVHEGRGTQSVLFENRSESDLDFVSVPAKLCDQTAEISVCGPPHQNNNAVENNRPNQEMGLEFTSMEDFRMGSIIDYSDQNFDFENSVYFGGSSFTVPAVQESSTYELVSGFPRQGEVVREETLSTTPSPIQDSLSTISVSNSILFQATEIGNTSGFGLEDIFPYSADKNVRTDENVFSSIINGSDRCIKSVSAPCEIIPELSGSKSKSCQDPSLSESTLNKTNCHRKSFEHGWRTLLSKASHMKARTGAVVYMKALFENEIYPMEEQSGRTRTDSNQSNSSNAETGIAGNNTTSETDDDDHRYAAVIVTQKRSSSGVVKDHQYNEINSPRRQTQTTVQTDVPIPSSESVNKLTYFKSRYKREKQLASSMGVLFLKKINLEARTGAVISLKISYEDFMFTEENYKNADSILTNKRGTRFVSKVITPIEEKGLDGVRTMSIPTTSGQSIVISVNRNSVKLGDSPGPAAQVHFVWKNKSNENLWQKRLASLNPVTSSDSSPNPILATTPQFILEKSGHNESNPRLIEIPGHSFGACDSSSMEAANQHQNTLDCGDLDSDGDSMCLSGPPSISASMIMIHSPEAEERKGHSLMTVSDENSNVGIRSEVGSENSYKRNTQLNDAGSMRDVGTITEPVCQVCDSSFPPSSSKTPCSVETLWIRCFNSMCQRLFHPSCIGFRVLSSSELNMLPAYFCSDHR